MTEVEPGDVIFSAVQKQIVAVSLAKIQFHRFGRNNAVALINSICLSTTLDNFRIKIHELHLMETSDRCRCKIRRSYDNRQGLRP